MILAELLSPETFEFFARYLLAGYVVILVRSHFVSGIRMHTSELLLEAVVFSLLIQMLLFFAAPALGWLYGLAAPSAPAPVLPERMLLFLDVLVVPSALGAFLGWHLASGGRNTLLRHLAQPLAHPSRQPRDFAFAQIHQPCLVAVTYTDGTVLRGYLGDQSMATDNDARSDIYLERLYSVDKDGHWQPVTPARSGLLSLDKVRSIEFLEDEEVEHGAREPRTTG